MLSGPRAAQPAPGSAARAVLVWGPLLALATGLAGSALPEATAARLIGCAAGMTPKLEAARSGIAAPRSCALDAARLAKAMRGGAAFGLVGVYEHLSPREERFVLAVRVIGLLKRSTITGWGIIKVLLRIDFISSSSENFGGK